MPRLLLVDDDGGRLALLAAGMLALEGAPGFLEVVPCALTTPSTDPLPAACLAEVGLLLPPALRSLASLPRGPGDVLLSLGLQPHPEALAHLPSSLPPDDAPPLARRAGARIARDQLARHLAALLPTLPPRG